jgi:acyl-CoA dehydrogenase
VLNGAKRYITNAPVADLFTIFAAHPDGGARSKISAFVVDRGAPGLRIGKVIPMAGGAFHSEIVFENLSVLRENRLGREGEGFAIAMQCLDAGRINWAAYCVGAAQQLLDASVAHVKAWRQFAPGARFAPSGFWKAPRKSYAISLRATCCAIRRART